MTASKKTTLRSINSIEKQLTKAIQVEKNTRKRWNKAYKEFLNASQEYIKKTRLNTKSAEKLRTIINNWSYISTELTAQRDEARAAIIKLETELKNLQIELAKMLEQQNAEQNEKDEIVKQTFLLNDTVVAALQTRNNYLTSHVYKHLYDDNGKLKTQVSFVNSDKTRMVKAMVNTITFIETDAAEKAKKLINNFFDSFVVMRAKRGPINKLDETTEALHKLTKQLLVEKTKFKVGPDLYRFLSLEIDAKVFPELKEAQMLLRGAIRSEKTNSYIRLYVKSPTGAKWEPIKQN